MLFRLISYIQPTHYFGRVRDNGSSVFPIVNRLPIEVKSNLVSDTEYISEDAKAYDLSYQTIQKGYVGNAETYSDFKAIPLEDEYRFLRKQVHGVWVIYTLGLRLFSFKNPFKEIPAFIKTRGVKKIDLAKEPLIYEDYKSFASPLLKEQPLISIIIPTLNRYAYLEDVLKDLEKQDYPNIEVLVVDQSQPFQSECYKDFNLNLTLIHQEEKALWLARNTAIKEAKGNYLLFFDDDSRIASDWVRQHLQALDYFKADVSSGVSISRVGAKTPAHYAYFKLADQLDTGNVLIKRQVFEAIGLFDRQFEGQRMGDGEFGCRAYKHGFKNVSNPLAKRLHLKVDTGGLRTMGAWDAFRTTNLLQPRPIPSVLYYFRRYYGTKRSLLALLKTVPLAIMPYRFKANKGMTVLGILVLVFIWPLILIQVWRSWALASKKLKQGPLIESL